MIFTEKEFLQRVPLRRALERTDEALNRNDYSAAERVLKYWIEEARSFGDKDAELTLSNELMGLFRKLNRKEDAYANAERALELAAGPEVRAGEVATTYINAATVFKAFGEAQRGLPYFEKARELYEKELMLPPENLAGLYNNMGLALVDIGRFDEARELYHKALAVLTEGGAVNNQSEGGTNTYAPEQLASSYAPERAITWLNIASCEEAEFGLADAEERIRESIASAWELIGNPNLTEDGKLAFAYEKCAPVFGYYGYFVYEEQLREKARKIYDL